MRFPAQRFIIPGIAALTLCSTVFLSSSLAQDNPPPVEVTLPCAGNVSVQVLGRIPVPDSTQDLALVRIIWGPDGYIGAHTHPGMMWVVVESGSFGLTLIDDMEMTVTRTATEGTPAAVESLVPGEEVALEPGDGFPEMGMVHSARNLLSDGVTTTIFSGLVEQGQPLTSCVEE